MCGRYCGKRQQSAQEKVVNKNGEGAKLGDSSSYRDEQEDLGNDTKNGLVKDKLLGFYQDDPKFDELMEQIINSTQPKHAPCLALIHPSFEKDKNEKITGLRQSNSEHYAQEEVVNENGEGTGLRDSSLYRDEPKDASNNTENGLANNNLLDDEDVLVEDASEDENDNDNFHGFSEYYRDDQMFDKVIEQITKSTPTVNERITSGDEVVDLNGDVIE